MKLRLRATAVVLHSGRILSFLAIDPYDGREFHFLPGGEIGPEEAAPDAALRETIEETGFEIIINPSENVDKEYDFHWNGRDHRSLTIFYRGRLKSPIQKPRPVHDADYNKGVVWVPLAEVTKVFGYNKEILEAIEELLSDRK